MTVCVYKLYVYIHNYSYSWNKLWTAYNIVIFICMIFTYYKSVHLETVCTDVCGLVGDSLTINYTNGEHTVRVYHAAMELFAIFKLFP